MIGNVIKRNENDYIINVDLNVYGSGYNVVPKEIDPENKYNINEVVKYVKENPDKVYVDYNVQPSRFSDEAIELSNLEHWFTWYDNQVVQFNRAVRLGEPFDNNIIELDLQAKANAERLKQLKAALNQ